MGRRSTAVFLLAAAAAAGCVDATPCPAPLEACGGVCYDLRGDRLHCGACGNPCAAGLVCSSARCVRDANAACPDRVGGAFVTLSVCGETVKGWFTAEAFIARAAELAGDPTAAGALYPSFDLRSPGDCDGQWTWHVDPDTAAFQQVAVGTSCDACPSDVERSKAFWVATGEWCPAPTRPTRVLAVDRRP